ncbi:MAG: ankyrin repeat domain-containing protein [Armatimonadetes bacterium]|nr:ankyrin repeat domain-containing protein [Armatimonadota bacterium]
MNVWMIVGLVVLLLIIGFLILELPRQHRFIDYCGKNDPERVRKWLHEGADPNKAGLFGLTPLGVAIDNKKLENVRILVEAGATIKPTEPSRTPLHIAVESGDPGIAEFLLESGADPNFKDKGGRSAFMEACNSLKPEMAELLLSHEANVNLGAGRDGEIQEPTIILVVAQCSGLHKPEEVQRLTQVVKLMLDAGANVNARSSSGMPLVVFALSQLPVLQLLVDYGAITDVAHDGIEYGEIIAVLLEEHRPSER